MTNILLIREYNLHGNLLYKRNSNGFEAWYRYYSNGNLRHYKDSYGYEVWYEYEEWYDSDGRKISKEEYKKLHGAHP